MDKEKDNIDIKNIDNSRTSNMDIFSKGFVDLPNKNEENNKNIDNQILNNKEETEPNIQQKEEIQKAIIETPSNQEVKIQKTIIETQPNQEVKIENPVNLEQPSQPIKLKKSKRIKKTNKKKKIFIIGIVLEILIIGFLIWFTFFRKNYSTIVECTDTVQNKVGKYYITTDNLYYFDNNNEVVRTKSSITYTFDNKKVFDKFKTEYVDTSIKNVKGIEQTSSFDDNSLKYQSVTTYDYRTLKFNKKNVKVEDRIMTINVKDREEPLSIYIQNMEEVAEENNNNGFICNQK